MFRDGAMKRIVYLSSTGSLLVFGIALRFLA